MLKVQKIIGMEIELFYGIQIVVYKEEKITLKGGVGHFGETSSRSLEFENTQPEKICHFLTETLLQHTRTRT